MSSLLEVRDVYGGYGDSDILKGFSLEVEQNEIVCLIGPNGAGKSTAMKSLFGLVRISQGEITLRGRSLKGLSPSAVVRRGVGFVPQVANVFASLSIVENLEMGGFLSDASTQRAAMAHIFDLFPPLRAKKAQKASTLSGGMRQMLAMGRALMLAPEILLLDEPTAGLSPLYVEQIFQMLMKVRESGVTLVIVEQNARRALEISDRAAILVNGMTRRFDRASNLLNDEEIGSMFLGR